MKIKTKIYSNRQKNLFKLLHCVAWYTLRELGMKTEIKIDTENLIEIVGRGSAGSLLKKNKVTIFLDNKDIFVKFSSQMRNSQKFWELFEKSINNITSNKKTIFLLNEIFKDLNNLQDENKHKLNNYEIFEFVFNFFKKKSIFPNNDEIQLFLYSRDKIKKPKKEDSNNLKSKTNSVSLKKIPTNDVSKKLSDIFSKLLKNIPTLTEEEYIEYSKIYIDLNTTEKKEFIIKIKSLVSDLDKIPNLRKNERIKLRKDLFHLSLDLRRQKIQKLINQGFKKK
jgi:hypothetical protein